MDPNACIQKCFVPSALYLQLRRWIELLRVWIARNENHRLGLFASESQVQVVAGVRLSHPDRLLRPLGRAALLAQRVIALRDKVSENRLAFRTVSLENGTGPLHLLRRDILRRRRLLLGKHCRMSLGMGEKVGVLATKAAHKVRETGVAFRSLRRGIGHQFLVRWRFEVVTRENGVLHAILQLQLIVHVFNFSLLLESQVVAVCTLHQFPVDGAHRRALREESLEVPFTQQHRLVVLGCRGRR